MRTRVRSRFGLVQGMCRVPGHERVFDRADLTASAGPVLAVDRRKFLALGGYDPVYFPGRIEDLDLGFRGWMAGWGLFILITMSLVTTGLWGALIWRLRREERPHYG